MSRIATEHIRDDGTMDDCFIETYYAPIEYVTFTEGGDGYVRIVSDHMGGHIETRISNRDALRLADQIRGAGQGGKTDG